MPKARIIPPCFKIPTKQNIRSNLDMDAQLAALRHGFTLFPDPRSSPRGEADSSGRRRDVGLRDVDPSLLAFDDLRCLDAANLMRIFGITQIPCDTQMRSVLDLLDPKLLRPFFRVITAQLQRGNALQQLIFYHYFPTFVALTCPKNLGDSVGEVRPVSAEIPQLPSPQRRYGAPRA